MKKTIILIIIFFSIKAIAQDGSDINYIKVSKLDNSYIGKIVHLDFYNRSFGGLNINNRDLNDKVFLELENQKIEFKEHRSDDGHNNWFSEQYLESIEFIDGYKIRITMCRIEEVLIDSIKVKLFVKYIDSYGKAKTDELSVIEYSFPKKIIAEILVKD
ncbi:hypothetical protein [Flavobacterium stagni]|uniref:Uncharacterized protein n=1 Tax=Flavobacterium stagni TaxID=2506421 RepID=A0A4Q1K3B0_9FLAO|nr:hypothetical protein [Flavobacterium stagni]RXR18871.1 hypothetical protein EQG61_13650 [Flavobacterium stagni]